MFSIDLHKKLMWIPLVNAVALVVFPFTIRGVKIGERAWWMLFAYYIGFYFAGIVLFRLITMPFPQDSVIVSVCSLYLFPLFINFGLLKYREKYFIF